MKKDLNRGLKIWKLRDGVYEVFFIRHRRNGECKPVRWPIVFQQGAFAPRGNNGLSVEALLAICLDYLRDMNEHVHSDHNDKSIDHISCALAQQKYRLCDRSDRGVLGTMEP